MRMFLDPKVSGVTPPWSTRPTFTPAHVEVVEGFSARDAGDFFLLEAWGTESQLNELAGKTGPNRVEEVPDTDEDLEPGARGRMRAMYQGKVTVEQDATGRQMISSLKVGIDAKQRGQVQAQGQSERSR